MVDLKKKEKEKIRMREGRRRIIITEVVAEYTFSFPFLSLKSDLNSRMMNFKFV